ncbi:MAG: lipoate--protein ligase family protein [Candidatus Omnitrophota bacterium]
MKTFRLIISEAAYATYNMELDEKIFSRFLEDRIPVFRVYRWARPAFTYGAYQNPEAEIDLKQCALDGVEVVKRITGGGILFHHDEITYSFVCDKTDVGEPSNVFVSYREICAFLINFYASLGLKTNFALESKDFKHKSASSELCSNSYEKYDILINGKKIGGNAQKRKRQVIFQHGSIPMSIDWNFVRRYIKNLPLDIAISVTSLSEELGLIPEKDIIEQKLVDSFSSAFGIEFIEESFCVIARSA